MRYKQFLIMFKRLLLQQKNSAGISLVEALIGVFIVTTMALGVAYVQQISIQAQNQEKLGAVLSQKRIAIQNTITSDAAWLVTIAASNNGGSNLSCTMNLAGCGGLTGPFNFSLYDAANNPVYISGTGNGLNLDGSQCLGAGSSCPFLLSLTWAPTCGTPLVDPNCNRPLITVKGIFSISPTNPPPGPINLSKYNFTVTRQALSWSPCTQTQLAIIKTTCSLPSLITCESTGWTCVPPNPLYCKGNALWTDAVTSYGPCEASITAPGYLHDTLTPALLNNIALVPATSGTAIFLCIPGQPNNGFIVQPGATCALSPIPGQCGTGNGGTYINAASVPTPLCKVGSPTPASLSDPGGWGWNCSGSHGGAPAACGASVANCPVAQMLTWVVGSGTCSGPTPAGIDPGGNVNIVATVSSGTANFTCAANGAWNTSPNASPAPTCASGGVWLPSSVAPCAMAKGFYKDTCPSPYNYPHPPPKGYSTSGWMDYKPCLTLGAGCRSVDGYSKMGMSVVTNECFMTCGTACDGSHKLFAPCGGINVWNCELGGTPNTPGTWVCEPPTL